jgi:uncharacterized membrane protein YqaE (UPF0057 family)
MTAEHQADHLELIHTEITMVRASDVVLMLVALLFPPISAAMITGCSCDLLINVVRSTLHPDI